MYKERGNVASASTTIKNSSGLYLRLVGILCKEVLLYRSEVSLKIRTTMANAKGVLSVLSVCAKSGGEITSVREGPDEEEALAAMMRIVEDGLGE